ncbi:hypothetical protein [Actinomadura fibrosa]|uniref:Tetratricopeptide repeat protein n=1 Tax=Actinomadura fibrosa TaxID=111802 RepID=A0ABW2XZ23_9ACTN|nr:hypothetical protein [Actinomadura fibrosa]
MTGEELDADVRTELRTLPKDLAGRVARHLVMAGQLAEEEPERAYKHARAARRLASRVGVVREAAGLAAYRAGEWAEALAELRAARRLSAGDDSYLPVMADCERGLGRPERALDLVKSPEAERLDPMGRVELRIVESGVRRDLGQYDAAVVTLQIPELRDRRLRPWSARLFYAYADALVEAGREDEASDWFARAAAADRDGETDAAERYAELEGLHILDTEEEEDEIVAEGSTEQATDSGDATDGEGDLAALADGHEELGAGVKQPPEAVGELEAAESGPGDAYESEGAGAASDGRAVEAAEAVDVASGASASDAAGAEDRNAEAALDEGTHVEGTPAGGQGAEAGGLNADGTTAGGGGAGGTAAEGTASEGTASEGASAEGADAGGLNADGTIAGGGGAGGTAAEGAGAEGADAGGLDSDGLTAERAGAGGAAADSSAAAGTASEGAAAEGVGVEDVGGSGPGAGAPVVGDTARADATAEGAVADGVAAGDAGDNGATAESATARGQGAGRAGADDGGVPEIVAATAIEFKPADPGILQVPAEEASEDAPEAPAVFLEPKQDAGTQDADDGAGEGGEPPAAR